MLETFTPAVCGSRKRQIVAQALFAATAVATAATLGLVLGALGSALGARQAVLAAAGLALIAAAREAGIVRFPLPQARRQVPERWRFELPLPVWATGYGAGLGAGFFTYQPVSTFWVACAAALALGRPLPAALCLSLYGVGRAAMVVWPRRRGDDPTAAVERLAGRRGALLRANAATLVACGVLLALAPAAGGAVMVQGGALDPSVDRGNLAFATQDGSVVIRPLGGGPDVVIPDAREPSLSGNHVAVVDGAGVTVWDWQSETPVETVPGVSHPALAWPLLAYVRVDSSSRVIVVRNLENPGDQGQVRARVKRSVDLGRPSLRGNRLAWHTASRRSSSILVKTLGAKAPRVVARSRISLLANPSLAGSRIVWVEQRSGKSYLRVGSVRNRKVRTLERLPGRGRTYWTTALSADWVYATRWRLATGGASILGTRR
jgi:cytochrome c biogenesis protein CcdA